MSEDCCATSCDVREGIFDNPVRSVSGSGDENVAENFLRNLRITKIDQHLSN